MVMKNTEEKDRQHGIKKEESAQSTDNGSGKKPQAKEEKEWQEKAEKYLEEKPDDLKP